MAASSLGAPGSSLALRCPASTGSSTHSHRWPVAFALLAPLLLAPACTVRRETVVPIIDAASVSLTLDPEGPWREPSAEPGLRRPSPSSFEVQRSLAQAPDQPLDQPALTRARLVPASPPAAVRLPVPAARGLSEAAPKGARPTRPHAEVARERFLDHPTEIEAEQITLYAPPEILAQGQLTGAQLSEPSPGRRIAVGEARLALRELTLRAQRITLRTRAGSSDIQITARGAVQFVSRQREQVLREQDLKGLILTNDQLTPLR